MKKHTAQDFTVLDDACVNENADNAFENADNGDASAAAALPDEDNGDAVPQAAEMPDIAQDAPFATRQEILGSVQYRWRKHQAGNYLIVLCVTAGLMLVIDVVFALINGAASFGQSMLSYLVFAVILCCAVLPFYLSSRSKCRYLLEKGVQMPVYTVTLDKVRLAKKNFASFTVTFTTPQGTATGDTNAMFCLDDAMGEITGITYNAYKDKQVRILFDQKKKAVYVLG